MVTRLVTGCVRPRPCVRETCMRLLDAAWGVAVCKIILSFVRVCRVGVWFHFVWSALLLAVGTCAVLLFGALPGLSCFLRVTQSHVKVAITALTGTGIMSHCTTNTHPAISPRYLLAYYPYSLVRS